MTPFTVNTNIASLKAQHVFSKNTNALNRAMETLTTGLKVAKAKDDPASFAISERLNTQIVGNSQILENIQIGMSILNISEGNMRSITNDLMRIRDLALQASNSYYTKDVTNLMIDEMQTRLDNINQLAKSTNFNDLYLLDGSVERLYIQIENSSSATTNVIDLATTLKNCTTGTEGLDIDLDDANIIKDTATAEDFAAYVQKIDDAIAKITAYTSSAGSQYNKLDSTYNNLSILIEEQEEAKSTLIDVDMAKASSELTKYQILQQASSSILMQANAIPEMALQML